MTNNYHEPIPKGAPGYSWIPNRCFADLDEALGRAALQTDSDDNVNLGRGDYTGHHLILNGGHLWVDSQGNLRFSGSAPASDNGGTLLPKAPPTPPPPETGGDITDPVLTTPVRMQQLRGNFTHAFSLLAIGDDGLLVGTGQDGRYGAAYVWGSDTPTVAGSFRSYQGFSDRFVYTFEDAGSALLIGTGPLGNVYRSTDRGQTWQLTGKLRTRSEQGGGAEVRAIKHIGNGVVLAVASLTRRVWKSTDAGATWRDTGQVFARGGGLTRIYGLTVGTNGRVIATTDARNSPVYISDNQGETWNFPNTPPPGLASGTGLAAIERLPGGRLVAGTSAQSNAQIYLSDGNGQTWRQQGGARLNGGRRTTKILSLGGTRLLAATGTAAGIYESNNNGNTWHQVVQANELGNASWVWDMARVGKHVYVSTTAPAVWRII